MLDCGLKELVVVSFVLREPVSGLNVSKNPSGKDLILTLLTWCSSLTEGSRASDILN